MVGTSSAGLWVTRPVPVERPTLRLLCFPHAGGGAAQYRPWASLLPPGVELNPVRMPGRETRLRERLFTRMPAAIDAFLEESQPYLDTPFAIFGHSMGALFGFELARRLVQLGGPLPVHLFVSGRRAPSEPDPEPAIHALPETSLLAALAERYGPESITLLLDPELREHFLPILRADLEMIEAYQYVEAPALPCPITAFGGLADTRATTTQLAAWQHATSAAFAVHRFAGGHFFHHPARQALMAIVSAALLPADRST
jgi:medium-chain acyl-[acyl-carrier-protein] hydrolase